MAAQVDIGNLTTLIIKIPARGATDWAAEFKSNFADVLVEHDHTSGQGSRIKNAALVTNTMVANGDGVTKVDGTVTAYTSADVAVSTDTIQDAAVTKAKMANNSVGLDELEKTVVITQDTTITTATYNTHFIIESTATSNVTLTFNAVEVSGCLFTRGGNTASVFTPIIKLIGAVDFNYNKIDMLNNGSLNINEVNLDTYKFVYNDISIASLLADVDGTDTGITNSGPAGGTFTFNHLKIYSLSNSIKFPFGTSQVNKFEFLVDGSGTPTFQDHVMDTDGAIRTTYNIGAPAANIIIFNGGGVTYKTATGTGSGTITTITDTKPFKIIDRTTKVSLDPALADLKDVASTSPTTGQVLKWSGSEWAPATDQAGSGGGSITTIASQSDANSYSPSEGDVLKVTANVNFDNVTFNKIKMYVAETNTLTFKRSTLDNIEILGGSVVFSAEASQSLSLANSKLSACNSVTIHKDKVNSDEAITVTVKNVDIVCKEYAYYVTYTNYVGYLAGDSTTTSSFQNLSVNLNAIASQASTGYAATANFLNCRFIGAATGTVGLATQRLMYQHEDIGENINSDTFNEVGSVNNTNLIIGCDSGGLKIQLGTTNISSFT
tara:strand:+ start:221 stop:2041 length:1821 start_codon:yes stop_codon:yes gene_type:complete